MQLLVKSTLLANRYWFVCHMNTEQCPHIDCLLVCVLKIHKIIVTQKFQNLQYLPGIVSLNKAHVLCGTSTIQNVMAVSRHD